MRDIKRNRDGRTCSRRILIWTARAFLFLLLAGMGITLCSFVSSSKMLELKEVEVLGGSRADVGEIQRVLRQEFHRNLYGIRLQKVQAFLESQAWVRSAQVRRVFPNRLKILVAERRPVALAKIESELFLVDRFGVVLEPYGPKFQHLDLPVVRGLENSTQENVSGNNRIKMDRVMEVLIEFDSGAQRLSDKISEIDVSDPRRVAVVPQDHAIKVFLGDS